MAESPPVTPFSSLENQGDDSLPLNLADPYTQSNLNDVLLGEGEFDIPRVLISLSLEGEELLDFGAWKRWIQDCPEIANCTRIEGIYKSHSTLMILSILVVIWDWLLDDLACTFIG